MYKIIKTTTSVIVYEILTIQNTCFMFACVCHVWEGVLFFPICFLFICICTVRKVWRHQTSNQKPQIEGQTDNKTTKRKRKNKDPHTTTQKTKDQATRTPLKPEVNWDASEGLAVPARPATPVVLLLNDTNIIWYYNCVGHLYM